MLVSDTSAETLRACLSKWKFIVHETKNIVCLLWFALVSCGCDIYILSRSRLFGTVDLSLIAWLCASFRTLHMQIFVLLKDRNLCFQFTGYIMPSWVRHQFSIYKYIHIKSQKLIKSLLSYTKSDAIIAERQSRCYGALAQLVARYIRIVEVSGSNPLCSTTRNPLKTQGIFSLLSNRHKRIILWHKK